MPDITIRQVPVAEMLPISRKLSGYAFRPTPPLPDEKVWQEDLEYFEAAHFVLFEDGEPLACAAVSPMTQHVRGTIYQAGGLWGVATHPAARRKGYITRILARLHAYLHDEGMALATLYAFRESFYDRLGYTIFPQSKTASFSPASLLPLLKKEPGGEVELLEVAQGFASYLAFLQRQQRRIHGMGLFGEKSAMRIRNKNSFWLALARVNGEIKGVMLYKIEEVGDSWQMQVPRFYYDDSQGKYLLLAWFARHIDQVKEIKLRVRPDEYPETWLPDMNVAISSLEPPLGRVIAVPKVAGLHCGPGRFSARISDPFCPWNDGSYLFESTDGVLHVEQQEKSVPVDCDLDIHALSTLIYGTHEPDSFALRDWGNPSLKVQETMRSMFPPLLPYLHERF